MIFKNVTFYNEVFQKDVADIQEDVDIIQV